MTLSKSQLAILRRAADSQLPTTVESGDASGLPMEDLQVLIERGLLTVSDSRFQGQRLFLVFRPRITPKGTDAISERAPLRQVLNNRWFNMAIGGLFALLIQWLGRVLGLN